MRNPGLAALALACTLAAGLTGQARAAEITVFAAASLGEVLETAADRWEATTGNTAVLSFAGSSALARQIQQGAPADVFISANVDWMDVLEDEGLLVPDSRSDLLTNSLVLVAPDGTAAAVEVGPDLPIGSMLGDGRIAMAMVDAVPAGIYGRAALEHLGLWDEVAGRVAQTDNVRAALALVSTGEAPLGIVYATDALADPGVAVLGTFPETSHPPIIYPAAAVAGGSTTAAAEFLDFLNGAEADAIFARHGFGVVGA